MQPIVASPPPQQKVAEFVTLTRPVEVTIAYRRTTLLAEPRLSAVSHNDASVNSYYMGDAVVIPANAVITKNGSASALRPDRAQAPVEWSEQHSDYRRENGDLCRPRIAPGIVLDCRIADAHLSSRQLSYTNEKGGLTCCSRRFHVHQLSGRRLFSIYLRSVVLVAYHGLRRPVPPTRRLRLG